MRLSTISLELSGELEDSARVLRVRNGDSSLSFRLGSTASLLAALARARLADEREGWIDRERLLEDLELGGSHLNVLVFRLRRQFADAGIVDAPGIVERGHGRLRLGTTRLRLAPASVAREA